MRVSASTIAGAVTFDLLLLQVENGRAPFVCVTYMTLQLQGIGYAVALAFSYAKIDNSVVAFEVPPQLTRPQSTAAARRSRRRRRRPPSRATRRPGSGDVEPYGRLLSYVRRDGRRRSRRCGARHRRRQDRSDRRDRRHREDVSQR